MGALYGTSINVNSRTFARLTDDTAILAQWVRLVLMTETGIYWSSPETGKDVCDLIAKGLTPQQLAAVPSDLQAAIATDQRIASASVTATTTYTAVGQAALSLLITVTPKGASVAPFSLTAIASAAVVTEVTRGLVSGAGS